MGIYDSSVVRPAEPPGREADHEPTPAEEQEVRELLEEESPDGRPPTRKVRKESEVVFLVALIAVAVLVLSVLYFAGGPIPATIGALLAVLFVGLAAWPAWTAAVERKIDRD